MNEQIKQLWAEAAKTTQSDSWEEQTKFMERFAELIVRECVREFVRKQPVSVNVSNRARHVFKQFGVEE